MASEVVQLPFREGRLGLRSEPRTQPRCWPVKAWKCQWSRFFVVEFRHERSDKGWCWSTEVDMWLVLPGEAYNTLCV